MEENWDAEGYDHIFISVEESQLGRDSRGVMIPLPKVDVVTEDGGAEEVKLTFLQGSVMD